MTFEETKLKYQEATILRQMLDSKLTELRNKLISLCPHDNVYEKEEHISGSYYDRAIYWTEIHCQDCGTLVKKTNTTFGGYG